MDRNHYIVSEIIDHETIRVYPEWNAFSDKGDLIKIVAICQQDNLTKEEKIELKKKLKTTLLNKLIEITESIAIHEGELHCELTYQDKLIDSHLK